MNRKTLVLGAVGISAGLVAACGGNNGNGGTTAVAPPPPPGQTTQEANTAQVLGLAQETSEVSSPFAVNGGAFTITDSSETSSPVPVSMM
jgi:hypothetical protein